jgi:hypothetical protein
MKPLPAALIVSAAGLLAWSGARFANIPYAFGALMSQEATHATDAALRKGAALPQAASHAAALAAIPGAPAHAQPAAVRAAVRAASTPTASASEPALGQSPRERLAALRAPLSPEAQNDPFSVQSWLPPPPPPPPAPVAVVQEAPPVAPPLPFSYVGTLNRDQDKPQVFLANGDQLLIVSPGEVIDGRYRFESIAATGAVFTYLPLNETQVMTIDGEGAK